MITWREATQAESRDNFVYIGEINGLKVTILRTYVTLDGASSLVTFLYLASFPNGPRLEPRQFKSSEEAKEWVWKEWARGNYYGEWTKGKCYGEVESEDEPIDSLKSRAIF